MIPIKMMSQPNDVTCGPTCLHSIYSWLGDDISLEQVISEVTYLELGGTLAVLLGTHALKRGYDVKIYSYNLRVFDPTWFTGQKTDILAKLNAQLYFKHDPKLKAAIGCYIQFLEQGGEILLKNLTPALLKFWFSRQTPIISGLCYTYLYESMREYTTDGSDMISDDVRGYPGGHFVVLSGYDEEHKHVVVADPYKKNPISGDNYYSVDVHRLINSIMLGILTYDSNLLIIQKKPINSLNEPSRQT